MSEFNYDTDGPDIDTIRSIAAEMANAGKPRPPTAAERQEHERWLAERQQADEQRQLEYRRRQEEIANKERVEAERQAAAIARAEARERARVEFQERTNGRDRDRKLSDLHAASIRQEQFRHAAVRSATFANQRQRLNSALDAALAIRNPPAPPESEIVDEPGANFGTPDFDIAAWNKKARRWW